MSSSCLPLLLLLLLLPSATQSFSPSPPSATTKSTLATKVVERNAASTTVVECSNNDSDSGRSAPFFSPQQRRGFLESSGIVSAVVFLSLPKQALAYTPDPDKLQESLYFISRVQEATVQQERFIRKLGGTAQLRQKLKLTLRLVDKNYKLLDQINFSSAYVTPNDMLVEASAAGYEAVDALQSAIEFVGKDQYWQQGDDDGHASERTEFLTDAMKTCREQLLVYTDYMPTDKLRNARFRVEDENIANRDEFDGDDDAGVYNPVNLPWKPVLKATEDYKKK
mmetsp:Transcript_106051/g.216279  ORF Transcript_106051/g.216279 Transcript_106051/m.216279 type:complete len:281 (+) Transcript_106051:5451-6293(+)|eukprot:CAMPEP_0201136098 /NCGR_PEP_ID=MMETSP0850-20130426/54693_1 /ASSEMBLY_ACC=CAM_ASM_000622 /TAXON_ID=183588 /ORGANISM="Pseudo-nitzschia fraudulenta, Strain WWA7" /LENGTH=280 /DNA_ID=CAMNT_0047407367 /DNA_START=2632 /DNA_END=3474 /DNA_ORIENTATION=+